MSGFETNGRSNGGMYHMDEDMAGQMVPGWIPYFSVADIDATHVRVVELGGTVLAGPEEHSDGGRALLISDAQGARCYLIPGLQAGALDRALLLTHPLHLSRRQ